MNEILGAFTRQTVPVAHLYCAFVQNRGTEMVTIGIRVKPTAVTFVVIDGENIVNIEDIVVPRAFEAPDALKYVRNNLLDLLREYSVERAGVRITESTAKTHNIDRIQIEGVIQEAFASSALKSYYVGQISTISARLGMERTDFKKMVNGENMLEIDGWEHMTKEAREAVLCALGARHVLA